MYYNLSFMDKTNFHHLYIFHTVATLGSFSKAAQALSISQPAVSLQIRELEKTLGGELLLRLRRGLRLTDTGETVFAYTQRIFALADEMRAAVQDIQGLNAGSLAVGSSTTPGEYILPWLIGKFRRRYPSVQVSLAIANTQSVIDRILAHELDIGMAGAPVDLKGLASTDYIRDRIVIIAAPDHAAARAPAPLREIVRHDFIMREPGSATRRAAEDCFRARGAEPKIAMELGSNEAVKRAVAAGAGLGVVSAFAVAADVAAGFVTVLDPQGWDCSRPLSVFYRDDGRLSPAQRAFLRVIQSTPPNPYPPTAAPMPAQPDTPRLPTPTAF